MMKIHFLNVGHGDCTIIEHESGHLTVIDINNGKELDDKSAMEIAGELGYSPEIIYNLAYSHNQTPYDVLKAVGYKRELENPISYIKDLLSKNYSDSIFRFILTHPDMDHMRGISVLRKEGISITNLWDTNHTKTQKEFYFPSDEDDWGEYMRLRGDYGGIKVLNLNRFANGHYFNAHPHNTSDGDGIYLFAPTPDLTKNANDSQKWNNLSYVLQVRYKGCNVILGGDAEQEVWDSILLIHKDELPCTILKASHHGRMSGFHEEAVKVMNPEYTIVSVGKKPDTDATQLYKKYTRKDVWSTRWKGNIQLTIDDTGHGIISSQYA